MPTLYRKYRPQTFGEIAGQEHIKLTLSFEITSGRIAHAYLFCGPRAIGKTTMARLLAKSVNCEKRKPDEADPCNKCQSCLEITSGASLDISEIDAASHTGVDNVRDSIIAAARIAPSRSRYKVFIIDEAHMLSTAAFNALLKIMEEPPAQVMFVLCTTEAHKLPATIISRCQRFDFKKISYTEIVKKLTRIAKEKKISVEPSVLEAVARHSGGHMRDADRFLGQIISLGGEENSPKGKKITLAEAELIIPRNLTGEAVELLEHLSTKDAANAVAYVNRLVDDGVDLKIFAQEIVEVMRRLLLSKVSPSVGAAVGVELGEGIEGRLGAITSRFDALSLAAAIERFVTASKEIKDAPIAQLPIELAIVDVCLGSSGGFSAESVSASSGAPRAAVRPTAKAPTSEGETAAADPALTQPAMRDLWQELLVKIRQHNHSLAFVLKSCQPLGMEDGSLKLAFKYKIHHDRINDPAIRQLVEGLVEEICGRRLAIVTTLDPELIIVENSKPEEEHDSEDSESRLAGVALEAAEIDSSVIDNLLKTFGGKVVS